MLLTSYLPDDDAVPKSGYTWFKQIFTVRIIARFECHKATHHVVVSGHDTPDDVVNLIGMLDLPLNRPHVVAHHLLARLEQAPDTNRLEGQFTLGTIIQFVLDQFMGISILR